MDVEGATDGETDARPGEAYRGLLGAFHYAYRATGSRLCRSYVVVGGLLAFLVAILFGSSLVLAVADTLGTAGGTFTFVRSFVLFVGLLVVAPLLAPILLVARRHRRGTSTVAYDRAVAASGYLFVPALYLTLVVTAPPSLRETPSGALAPVVEALYALPRLAGVLPPLVAVVVMYLAHRRYR